MISIKAKKWWLALAFIDKQWIVTAAQLAYELTSSNCVAHNVVVS